jgi:DNA integrity scanning protein DisA with diadenylate cyclase activity
MPIEHIVLIEKKETTPEEKLDAFFHSVNSLKDKIPGILEVKIGENFTERSPHSHAVIVTMEDRTTLAGYGPHPAHQEAANLLKEAAKDWVIVDIEI